MAATQPLVTGPHCTQSCRWGDSTIALFIWPLHALEQLCAGGQSSWSPDAGGSYLHVCCKCVHFSTILLELMAAQRMCKHHPWLPNMTAPD